MATDEAEFLARLAKWEGGYSNDKDDPGGRTFMGLSEAAFPFLWTHGQPTADAVHRAVWEEFYLKPGFDTIPDVHLREQLFDWAVNAGPRQPIKMLQCVLHVQQDGRLGPLTLSALAARDAREVNNLLVGLRETFYRGLVHADLRKKKFLNGWLKRARSFYLPDPTPAG